MQKVAQTMGISASRSIDLVGDIHGAADRLRRLLSTLGYTKRDGRWTHPNNSRLVFLGDYADKGSNVAGGIELVRELCDHRIACAIAGNHDTNALAFCLRRGSKHFDARAAHRSATSSSPDEHAWIRQHKSKNIQQHCRTLQLDASAYQSAIEWFATLPLWLEVPSLRAVHAAWIPRSIRKIRALASPDGASEVDVRRTDIAWLEARSIDEAIELQHARQQRGGISVRDWHALLDLRTIIDDASCEAHTVAEVLAADKSLPDVTHAVALERVLKGVECPLGTQKFLDSEGHSRSQVRIKWFDAAEGRMVVDHALVPADQRAKIGAGIKELDFTTLARSLAETTPDMPRLQEVIPFAERDAYNECPVFVGHYGFNPNDACILLRSNVACLDTSAYDDVRGALTAYRWSGEEVLESSAIVMQA
ncbi:MAG: metallophosphoesterase [Limnohabitans sp.]|jgi:hypothetical protein|nr:metallophosphoesterase [Limnohabitans sp.]